MGRHVANSAQRYGRERDLPHRRVVIEAAFIKALRDSLEGPELETLKTFYTFLDEHMLSEVDADVLNRWDEFVTMASAETKLSDDEVALAEKIHKAGLERAVKLMEELSKCSRSRFASSSHPQ